MPDKPLEQACDARVCIHTDQILDSCMDKDCVEDLRVYLTRESQAALDRSTGAKTRCAELLFARVEVEPLAYKRGHYAVDLTFYYRILGDATVGGTRPVTITGLAVFTKRVALYGGRGKAKTFSSTDALPTPDGLLQDRLPVGVVEALDPMILASKVREVCDCCRCETELTEVPPAIAEALCGRTVRNVVQQGLGSGSDYRDDVSALTRRSLRLDHVLVDISCSNDNVDVRFRTFADGVQIFLTLCLLHVDLLKGRLDGRLQRFSSLFLGAGRQLGDIQLALGHLLRDLLR